VASVAANMPDVMQLQVRIWHVGRMFSKSVADPGARRGENAGASFDDRALAVWKPAINPYGGIGIAARD